MIHTGTIYMDSTIHIDSITITCDSGKYFAIQLDSKNEIKKSPEFSELCSSRY